LFNRAEFPPEGTMIAKIWFVAIYSP